MPVPPRRSRIRWAVALQLTSMFPKYLPCSPGNGCCSPPPGCSRPVEHAAGGRPGRGGEAGRGRRLQLRLVQVGGPHLVADAGRSYFVIRVVVTCRNVMRPKFTVVLCCWIRLFRARLATIMRELAGPQLSPGMAAHWALVWHFAATAGTSSRAWPMSCRWPGCRNPRCCRHKLRRDRSRPRSCTGSPACCYRSRGRCSPAPQAASPLQLAPLWLHLPTQVLPLPQSEFF